MRLRPLTEAECYARCYDGRSIEATVFAHSTYDGGGFEASDDRSRGPIGEVARDPSGARREAA